MKKRFREGYDSYIEEWGYTLSMVETVPEIILGKALVQMWNKRF